jgi:hypothetical protein
MLKRIVIRVFLALAFFAAVAAIGMVFFSPGAFRPEVWAVGAAALAVLPAVFATWSTQRMLELQEDANAPFPYPSFDARSRYQVLQLRIQNHGKGIAKNVYLEWRGKALEAAEGGPAKYLTKECPVPILLPDKDESFSSTWRTGSRRNTATRTMPGLSISRTWPASRGRTDSFSLPVI